MGQWKPVPILRKYSGSNDPLHVQVAGLCLQADGAISTPGIDNARGHSAAEFGHGIFVSVADDLLHSAADRGHFGIHRLVLLHKHHRQRNQCTLPYKIGRVFQEGFEQVDGIVKTGARARDAQRHCRSVTHMRVV